MLRRREASLGKRRATRVRRLSSGLPRSTALAVRRRVWWAGGQDEDGQPLGQIFLHPHGQFGRAFGIGGDDLLEAQVGGGSAGAVENAAEGAGDLAR